MLTDTINKEHPIGGRTFNFHYFEPTSDEYTAALEGRELPQHTLLVIPKKENKDFCRIGIYDTDITDAFKQNIPLSNPNIFIGALWYITTRKKFAHFFPNNHIDVYFVKRNPKLIDYLKEHHFTVNEYKDHS